MADTFQLEVVTPDRLVVTDHVESAQIPARNGYLGILPGHAPLISELAVGELTYKADGVEYHLAVADGMAEVLPDRVTVLAETAERAEDIDAVRAEKARERAEKRLHSADPDTDFNRAQIALERALVRLQVASKKQ